MYFQIILLIKLNEQLAIFGSRRNSGSWTQRQFSFRWCIVQDTDIGIVGCFIAVSATKALVIGLASSQTSLSVPQFQGFAN